MSRAVADIGGGPRVVVSTAAFHARVRGSVPCLDGLKETKIFLTHPRVKLSIVGGLRDREVACSASDRQGSNFKSCVWRTVSSHSFHHPQEVILAQFSLYVHKGSLKPDSFHFFVADIIAETLLTNISTTVADIPATTLLTNISTAVANILATTLTSTIWVYSCSRYTRYNHKYYYRFTAVADIFATTYLLLYNYVYSCSRYIRYNLPTTV